MAYLRRELMNSAQFSSHFQRVRKEFLKQIEGRVSPEEVTVMDTKW